MFSKSDKREIRHFRGISETSVVNVKVAHIRPQWDNLKEFCSDKGNLYIGRRGVVFIDGERYPKSDSKWVNPFKISREKSRKDVVNQYFEYITEKIMLEPDMYDINELMDKRLGCWCYPQGCHGDVLVQLVLLWDKYGNWCEEKDMEKLDISPFLVEWLR